MKNLLNMNHKCFEGHPFHIVEPSPWPLLTSIALYSSALGFIMYFHFFNSGVNHLLFAILSVCICLTGWFYDVVREATFQGFHTSKVQQNIYLGMLLFIVSETMFFFAFFWGFFHFSLAPSIWIGGIWPPVGIIPVNPWAIPLLNTALLLSSGYFITCSHNAMMAGQRGAAGLDLIYTICLAVIFTALQLYEYMNATFSINDGVYGSIFYILTGFHGLHVFVGTIFLIVCLLRHIRWHFSTYHHVGYICAIWYWHFVDVVWIFLYLCLYLWGGA